MTDLMNHDHDMIEEEIPTISLTDAEGNHVPMGVAYAALVESNTPIVCQYSRIDTTQVNETFGTTMMF